MQDTYGHTPPDKALVSGDVYGVGYDENRASRRFVRLGVIGAGPVVQSKHWPAIQRLRTIWEPIEVVAFALRTKHQAEKVQSTFGGRWYDDYERMLADEELDGVIVCSSDDAHFEHSMACIERGIPVLVEKPITRSLEQARSLCATADERGVFVMTVSNKRYSPPYTRAKRFIEDGPVEDPAMIVGKFNLGYDYVDLFESGTIHLFDLARFLMGDARRVRAIGVNRYHGSRRNYPIDNAVVQIEFKSGGIGSLYTSSTALSFKPWERVEVYGDHAWLDVDDQYTLTLHADEMGGAQSWTPVMPNTLLFDEEFGGFMGLLENFAQCIRGAEEPLVSGWDGYKALELLCATEISLANGGALVDLPLDASKATELSLEWLRSSGWPGGQ
jgi:predicted dehydrogenase